VEQHRKCIWHASDRIERAEELRDYDAQRPYFFDVSLYKVRFEEFDFSGAVFREGGFRGAEFHNGTDLSGPSSTILVS
jgi:uncharacterized protein YjbI with pentapeptide repeats